MEVFKFKIPLNKYLDIKTNRLKSSIKFFSVNIFITTEFKDLGSFANEPFIQFNNSQVNYQLLSDKVISSGGNFNFTNNPSANFDSNKNTSDIRYRRKTINDYYMGGIIITGVTEDRLDVVSSYGYDDDDKYVTDFDVNREIYTNYLGETIDGVTRIVANDNLNPITYVEDANINDPNIGNVLQKDGIVFKTFLDEADNNTQFIFRGQGINQTNSNLSALTLNEYLLHITERPKVVSDVFIDRGVNQIMESHLRLSEISSIGQLERYNNKYYNIIKQ